MKKFIKEIKNNVNNQYIHETLLNYAFNRWGYNKSSSVGKLAELIRDCQPVDLQEWENYYFSNAIQNKKNGIQITREYIEELGKKLYIKLTEVVQSELADITEEECIDYAYNLVINRTYDGYRTEIQTIYGYLEKELNIKINSAPDEWDRSYSVDFYIKIKDEIYIGLQIKPVSGKPIDFYQIQNFHKTNHTKFSNKYKGKVFFVFSETVGGTKKIKNLEVIDEIKEEIERLKKLC